MAQTFNKELVLGRLSSLDPQEILVGIRDVGQVNDPDICAVLLGFIGHHNEDIVIAVTNRICFANICDFDAAIDVILDYLDQWNERVQDRVIPNLFHAVLGKRRQGKVYPRALAKFIEILDKSQPCYKLEVALEAARGFQLEETIPILVRHMLIEANTDVEWRTRHRAFEALVHFRTHTEETALPLIRALDIYEQPTTLINHPMRGNCTPRVRQAILEQFASGKMAYSLEEFIENLHSDVREELGL